MLLSHPKQSKNVRNTPEILVWVRCTDIMSVGPLSWDNNIFMGVLMSRGVQRVSNSKAHWDELQNCVEWGLGVFEYLTVTNWCSPQHVFYAAAVKSHQHLLLKKLVTSTGAFVAFSSKHVYIFLSVLCDFLSMFKISGIQSKTVLYLNV